MDDDLIEWNPEERLNQVRADQFLSGLVLVDPALKVPDFFFVGMKERFDARAEVGGGGDGGRRRDLREHLEKHAWATLGRCEFNEQVLVAPEAPRQRGRSRFPISYQDYDDSSLGWEQTRKVIELVVKYVNRGDMIEMREEDKDHPTVIVDSRDGNKHVSEVLGTLKKVGEPLKYPEE